MSDTRLCLLIGVPVFAILMNILAGVLQTNSLHRRFNRLSRPWI